MSQRQPAFFIPHGGGPCFFMSDPAGHWRGMGAFLRSLPSRLPQMPAAILVVSAHWETDGFRLNSTPQPPLIYDYNGFPPETYAIRYDVPGNPDLAHEAANLLHDHGLKVALESHRGLDHGVFVPTKVAFPEATIPVVEMSVEQRMDPALHLAAGAALAGLRERNVLIVASGMSFHNLSLFGDVPATEPSLAFDRWLTSALTQPAQRRLDLLAQWTDAPGGRIAHPTAEHLVPLLVAAGASETPATKVYSELVLGAAISGFRFE